MSKLAELCQEHKITITFVHEGRGVEPPTEKGQRPWPYLRFEVTLHRTGKPDYPKTIDYKMGLQAPPPKFELKPDGKPGEYDRFDPHHKAYLRYIKNQVPTTPDVLHSLLSDAQSYDSARDFDDFCSDIGWSNDSIRALKCYQECGEASKRIRAFLGDLFDVFAEAANEYDRVPDGALRLREYGVGR